MVFDIPPTAPEVTAKIATLLPVMEWQRDALLATVVRIAPRRGGDRRSADFVLSVFESPDVFAARDIRGLRSHNTVRRHVQRWLDVHGAYPHLGEQVTLPELEAS